MSMFDVISGAELIQPWTKIKKKAHTHQVNGRPEGVKVERPAPAK